ERLQRMWLDIHPAQGKATDEQIPLFADPVQWLELLQAWQRQMPWLDPKRQADLAAEGAALWDDILAQYGLGSKPDPDGPDVRLPRSDRRFADPAWRQQPVYALIHQTYLLMAERLQQMVDEVGGVDENEREQLRFATKTVLDAMSPANF